ncbi:MAG: tRNA (adenosine(37)-N6)-threonylcarbamoyltransferase complex transferase subunit TsaD [Bacteroidota bacterium]
MAKLLAIESSCDETSAAVMAEGALRSHVISSQLQHAEYGGVIPELASRLHQQQIVRVVQNALADADLSPQDLDGIAVTLGPGLLGALLVGTCFAKSMSMALNIPLIEVNHMQAHVLANFIQEPKPAFPFICLTVSGGHTQLVLVKDYLDMEVIGESIDDAAGEAFDKAAKLMGLPYPGGPEIDKLAKQGRKDFWRFPTPDVGRFSFSFSGLKTALLYMIRDGQKANPEFLATHTADICASYQERIVRILLDKMADAARHYKVRHLAIAGGVSANSQLREEFQQMGAQEGWVTYIPDFAYCTDNAAMIAMAGQLKFEAGQFAPLTAVPFTRGFHGASG